jgi:hypothetical protein
MLIRNRLSFADILEMEIFLYSTGITVVYLWHSDGNGQVSYQMKIEC